MIKNLLRLLLYFSGFVVAAGIALYLAFQLFGSDSAVSVPSLIGKSVSEATGILIKRGLNLEIEGEDYNGDVPPDHIIRQSIKAGENVQRGSGIGVIVSSGKSENMVPYLEGMDINDVRLTLKNLHMEIGKITRVHSDTVVRNRVITQRPLSGHYGESKVNLVVSLGPYVVSYICPSFIDMTIKEARRAAKPLGLKLVEKDEGRVIVYQKPEAGAAVKRGDSVEVTLGRGGGFWF
jgi:serine/threonine-protein kinase